MFRNPNIGDGKRSTCEGLPYGEEMQWCRQARAVATAVMDSIKNLAATMGQNLIVLENSILKTQEDSEMQVGHFDLLAFGESRTRHLHPAKKERGGLVICNCPYGL